MNNEIQMKEHSISKIKKIARFLKGRGVEKYMEDCEIELHKIDDMDNDGCLTIKNDKVYIYVKKGLDKGRELFVIAHELGHHMLHYYQVENTNTKLVIDEVMENEADLFAVNFLLCLNKREIYDFVDIPKPVTDKLIKKYGSEM